MDEASLAASAKAFLESFRSTLEQHSLTDFSTSLASIESSVVQRGPMPAIQHESMRHLRALIPDVSEGIMQRAASTLDWGQLYAGGGIDPSLAEGMFAAQAAGTYGVFAAKQVVCGLFLLAPGVYYPLHTHAAREVYCCLAGEIEITHRLDDSPIALSAGLLSETPSGRLHALRTRTEPVLLAYIWIGDISAPTWWWERDSGGEWVRTAWRRKPGESWKAEHSEQVSTADFRAAMS